MLTNFPERLLVIVDAGERGAATDESSGDFQRSTISAKVTRHCQLSRQIKRLEQAVRDRGAETASGRVYVAHGVCLGRIADYDFAAAQPKSQFEIGSEAGQPVLFARHPKRDCTSSIATVKVPLRLQFHRHRRTRWFGVQDNAIEAFCKVGKGTVTPTAIQIVGKRGPSEKHDRRVSFVGHLIGAVNDLHGSPSAVGVGIKRV